MACYFRGRSKDTESPYIERQAIEVAVKKVFGGWESNNRRLDFYETFEGYIKERMKKIKEDAIRRLRKD